jgi:UDP-glucose 4,6-dehydratase
MTKLIITGGLGFSGKHFFKFSQKFYKNITIIDKKTYSADLSFFKKNRRKNDKLLIFDICNYKKLSDVIDKNCIIVHFAAESHVDNSFKSSLKFTKSNSLGTHVLLEVCRIKNPKKIIIISTDEVYGQSINNFKNEKSLLSPTNPYSASKAAADLLSQSYHKSFKLPLVLIRSNNLYGSFQHVEKIIPATINAVNYGKKLRIHGKGNTIRHFLHIEDLCNAIVILLKKFKAGEIYNIAGSNYFKIIDLIKIISAIKKIDYKKISKFVEDRPFNDQNYKINCNKIKKLGWKEQKNFFKEISKITINNEVFKSNQK